MTARDIGKTQRDLTRVKKLAKAVLVISPNNKNFRFFQNNPFKLNALVVIGPAQEFEEQILLEIGMWRTRPYQRVEKTIQRDGHKKRIKKIVVPRRKKIFFLSQEQYSLVAPFLFYYLAGESKKKIRSWRSGSHFYIPSTRTWYLGESQAIVEEWKRPVPRGQIFSVAKADELIAGDILWAELNLNLNLRHILSGLAGLIGKKIGFYRRNPDAADFLESDRASEIHQALDKHSFPPYLREELWQYLPDTEESDFYPELMSLLRLPTELSPEQQLVEQAGNLPDPKQRVQDISLRLRKGLKRSQKHIVFEILPFLYQGSDSQGDPPLNDDDIPF